PGAARPDDARPGRLRLPPRAARAGRRSAAGGRAHRQGTHPRRAGTPVRACPQRDREGPLHPGATRARSTPRAGHRMKILLVEDNEMNRDMLSRRLLRRGYELVFAGDGQAAVEMALGESPRLILMDMGLPVIDGWEATRRIKADPRTS